MRFLATAVLVLSMPIAAMAVQGNVTTYDTSMSALALNSEWAYMPGNWKDFLAETGWNAIGVGEDGVASRAFFKWNIDWATLGTITNAQFKIAKNNEGLGYGIPEGAHLEFALVTEYWDLTAGQDMTPPNYWGSGPTTATPLVVTAPAGIFFDSDITSLMQTWQASPSSYFGIMVHVTDAGGGVIPPNGEYNGGVTGDLVLTSTPEPATLSLLAIGAVAMLRRRKTA